MRERGEAEEFLVLAYVSLLLFPNPVSLDREIETKTILTSTIKFGSIDLNLNRAIEED